MTGAGGKILGEFPDDLTDAGPLNIGRGRLIPTTSWDAVFNAVAEWAGITDEADLVEVLPNRNKFSRLFTRDQVFAPDPIPAGKFAIDDGVKCSSRLKALVSNALSLIGRD